MIIYKLNKQMKIKLNIIHDFYGRFSKLILVIIFFFSIISSLFITYLVDIDSNIINIVSVILSIMIGLMFNFSSSLSNKISSDHLNIKYKFKENRLDKLELSYKSSYFSIYISIICLIVCLILTAIPDSKLFVYKIVLFILIFLLLQMFLSFYDVLNDMKNFVNYDIKQERDIIKQRRFEEMNEDDNSKR